MTRAYYNEIDPFAAQWLRNLIEAGHIAPGDVDERDIRDVTPNDLRGYTQCHFFAGIGGWSCALRLAGWDDSRPVWTGSCPCQSFSSAGKGKGFADERHLWPAFFYLIEKCRPTTVIGEQVEAAIRYGWLDLVQNDLEGIDYAFGAASLPAASVGAPHMRQRLWFVAKGVALGNSQRTGLEGTSREELSSEELTKRRPSGVGQADTMLSGRAEGRTKSGRGPATGSSLSYGVALGDTYDPGPQGRSLRSIEGSGECPPRTPGPTNGFWGDAEWIACRDGKARAARPGIAVLVNGSTNRVDLLRGFGNAIVAPLAAEVIKAAMDVFEEDAACIKARISAR